MALLNLERDIMYNRDSKSNFYCLHHVRYLIQDSDDSNAFRSAIFEI